ncbi:Hypothetical protein CINCED_3A004638 [Cinara cedri]|uniref:Uncharacterized protein n=1 Tax=Cinara cedri TaxID=506608 RepID=A0A5E4N0E8_9HEMI|nr:Hypothetical protein CINCED_3A004638 [Cinara cedri]
MAFKLILELSYVSRKSVRLEWNKQPNILDPLFKLYMNENGRNWIIVGYRNYFCVNNLCCGCTYNFKLCMVSNDEISATVSYTTKNDFPSITAFHHSISQNLPLLFREFLDTRAKDINVYNELGQSGLFKACAAGHNDMVLTLIRFGADVNLPNMFTKVTPLMTAAYHGYCDVIRILAHNDADASLRDINSKTALHYAVDGSKNNAVKMLLEEKWCNVNLVDSRGWTPIMRAVLIFANLDVIKTLINHGSDLKIKDKNGQNVWQLAHLSNNWEALKILPD